MRPSEWLALVGPTAVGLGWLGLVWFARPLVESLPHQPQEWLVVDGEDWRWTQQRVIWRWERAETER
jgi:hypothetical protein